MTHHLTSQPIVIRRRDGSVSFIDWDFGFRMPVIASLPHLRGHETRRSRQRAGDPLVGA